ncbi:MAG: lysoplasmalogenase family protein [Erysipelotrichaceae bacterium]
MMWVWILLYLVLFVVLMLTCYQREAKTYYVVAKTLQSVCFVIIALWGMWQYQTWNVWMLLAFVLCLSGDVLLAISIEGEDKIWFLAGLFSFLFAHCAFIVALLPLAAFGVWDLLGAGSSFLFILFLIKNLPGMNVRGLEKSLLLYSVFVGLLFGRATQILFHTGIDLSLLLIWLGAGLFFLSDAILLFLYFYEKKWKWTKFFNLFMYYGGLLLLALSLWG